MRFIVVAVLATLWVAAYGATVLEVDTRTGQAVAREATPAEVAQAEADRAAEAAAQAEAALRAMAPVEFATGIALPAQTNSTPTYAVGVDETGTLLTWLDHASPRDPAAANSNKLAAIAAAATYRADLRALRQAVALATDMTTTNIADVQAIDTTATTAAARQTQISALRAELLDTNRRLKDTLQALQDVRRLLLAAYKESEP